MDDSEEPLLSLPPRPSKAKRWASLTLGLLAGGAVAGGGGGIWLWQRGPLLAGPPRWPQRYEVSYTIAFPETLTTQSQLLTYSLVAYRDEPAGLQKVVRDKVETVLEVLPNLTMYQRFPRVDTYDCWAVSLGGGKGPTMQGAAAPPPPPASALGLPRGFAVRGGDGDDDAPKLTTILPDLSDGTWRYNRTASSLEFLDKARKREEKGPEGSPAAPRRRLTSIGDRARLFPSHLRRSSSDGGDGDNGRKRHRGGGSSAAKVKPVAFSRTLETAAPGGGYGAYTSRWTFWVDARTGAPLRLEALSKNLWTGGHYDLTVAEFGGWRSGPAPGGAFDLPPGCPLRPPPPDASPPGALAGGSLGGGGGGRGGGAAVGAPPLPTDFLSLALPNRHSGHALYDQHLHSVTSSGLMRSRRTKTRREYRRRAEAFEASLRLVEAHNRDSSASSSSSYKLAINHLADLLPHERRHGGGLIARHPRAGSAAPPSLSSTKKGGGCREREKKASSPPPSSSRSFLDSLHEPSVPFESLPATVDWRGSPADSPVKDQAMCGSCWAFGTVGSLEAAVFRETGRQILLSEQQLVDCAWSDQAYEGKFPNAGCYGGYQTTAFDWYFSRGSAASQKAYPYRGVNNFCDTSVGDAVAFGKASSSEGGGAAARFPGTSGAAGAEKEKEKEARQGASGKSRYVWVRGGADGLREALLTKGPMTVSVDASPDDFALYSSGIYNNSKCQEKLSRLDHAVIVSGYGEDPKSGQKFWIVKNTWSVRWGEEGYLRIAVSPDDCGISSQPLYLELAGVREL